VTLTITVTATKPGTIYNKAAVTATNVASEPGGDDSFTAAVTIIGTSHQPGPAPAPLPGPGWPATWVPATAIAFLTAVLDREWPP
jgi:hypothetical protein